MINEIIAFLPCRMGSERVPQKNTKEFCNVVGGLTAIKLEQLIKCDEINTIVVSTDDAMVEDIARELAEKAGKPVYIYKRPEHLATSQASTDDVISHVPELITEGSVLWTHVTSPFVDSAIYSKAIDEYKEAMLDGTNDSLMTVTNIQTFLWDDNGPINYQREIEKWPRTQTLPTLYEVNSAIFLAPIETYKVDSDRIGKKPVLFPLSFPASVDIDTPDQFRLAESIWNGI